MCNKVLLAKINALQNENMKMKFKEGLFKKYKNEKLSIDEYKKKITKE